MPNHDAPRIRERPVFREHAESNTERWGLQEPIPLLLAIIEEVGELAHELAAASKPCEARAERDLEGWRCMMEAAELGRRTQLHLEATSETPTGDPLPEPARPTYAQAYRDTTTVQDELLDLGALCYQLAESLDHHTTRREP